jgi:NADH-quinone oxidoreductase subunit L
MLWPVGVLTVLATIGGFLQVPGAWNALDDWLHPVAESIEEASGGTAVFSAVAALLLSLAGIAIAWTVWGKRSDVPERARTRWPWATRTLERKFYFDEAYDLMFYEPSDRTASLAARYVEEPVFLRSLGGLGRGVREVSTRVAAAQTGLLRSYVLALATGLAVLAIVFLVAE